MLFKVSFTSQTSGSNNKLDIGTFKLGHPRLINSKTNNKSKSKSTALQAQYLPQGELSALTNHV